MPSGVYITNAERNQIAIKKWRHRYGQAEFIEDYKEFNGTPVTICKVFACISVLSSIEQLAGSVCTVHMNVKPININHLIKLP